MTTFLYTTTSDEVQVEDQEKVEELLSQYYFTVQPTLQNGVLSFFAESKPNAAFDVYEGPRQQNSKVEEFLSNLSQYIDTPMEIQCVETQGEGAPSAWKWKVTPRGEVSRVDL